MNVLIVHNYYQQAGGEDQVFLAEQTELRRAGLNVATYTVTNDVIDTQGALRTAVDTIWNRGAAREIARQVREHRADVVHFHNTFPIISPAAYYAARAEGAAVVQTIHNFRLMCAAAVLYRDGGVCESCVGRTLPVAAVKHACYRGSRAASAAVAALQVTHRTIGTYDRAVDAYIALTDFARDKLIEGGLPADRILVKPNFMATDPGVVAGRGDYALFVGRLTPEKGVRVLLDAWAELGRDVPLKIVGEGPLADEVEARVATMPGVEWLRHVDRGTVLELMRDARALIVPSTWYEGFPMTIVEAFACGLPVITSRLGSLGTIVEDGVTGVHFEPGSAPALRDAVRGLFGRPERLAQMRQTARATYLSHYTADENVRQLTAIYRTAIDRARPQHRTGRLVRQERA